MLSRCEGAFSIVQKKEGRLINKETKPREY